MPRPIVLLAVAACAFCSAPAAALADFEPGAPGAGDPFFPLEGNGGYDVGHYDLRLDYDPATQHLDGTASIRATATQDLSRFDLDLRGFDVSPASPSTARTRRSPATGRSWSSRRRAASAAAAG